MATNTICNSKECKNRTARSRKYRGHGDNWRSHLQVAIAQILRAQETASTSRTKRFILAVLLLIASALTLCGQPQNHPSKSLEYRGVTEFVFDEQVQDYVAADTVVYSGTISLGPEKIVIEGYHGKPDKSFHVLEKRLEEGTNRDMYICEIGGVAYALALSPDKKYLTQIGIDDKFIYELKASTGGHQGVELVPVLRK